MLAFLNKYYYHIISYHIISYHIISYHIISYHIISYHIISYHFISYDIQTSLHAKMVSSYITDTVLKFKLNINRMKLHACARKVLTHCEVLTGFINQLNCFNVWPLKLIKSNQYYSFSVIERNHIIKLFFSRY